MTPLSRLKRGVHRIERLHGFWRFAAAFGFGASSALAFAPFSLPFALIIALCGLALLLEGSLAAGKPKLSGFLTGTVFGAGFFAASTLWLANAFLVQAEAFAWMIPVVLPIFFAGMGLFYGLASLFHIVLRQKIPLSGLGKILPLVIGLGLAEWLRGHVFGGFPWNLHAQAMAFHPVALQPLAVLGPYGYGLVISLLMLLPAAALLAPERAVRAGVLFAGLSVLIAAYGSVRIAAGPDGVRSGAHVVLVQPNVAQRDKLDPEKTAAALRRNLEVTALETNRLPAQSTIYAVWPENAYPFLDRIADLPPYLARRLPPDSYLVSGSILERGGAYTNGLAVFGPAMSGSELAASYDKHRLVPFGETLPFASVFEALGIESLSPAGGGGFMPGPGPVTLNLGDAPFAPLICYEDIFPSALYPDGERPDWLVVVTNDAWFGDAAGPRQHLDIARMRAVETGLPVARAANTGISALIDASGRITAALPLYERGVISRALPEKRSETLYSSFPELFAFILLSLLVVPICLRGLQARRAASNYGG